MAPLPSLVLPICTAQLTTVPYQCQPNGLPCLGMNSFQKTIFATWQCAMFGAGERGRSSAIAPS